MANRGSLLPVKVRLQIAEMRNADKDLRPSYRKLAALFGISKTTVQKYARNIGTNRLNLSASST